MQIDKPFVVSLRSFLIHVTQKLSQSKELLGVDSPHILHHPCKLTIDRLSTWLDSSVDRALHRYRKVMGSSPVQA